MANGVAPNTSFWESNRLPVLLQTEAAECALVCLCMVSSYWGFRIDVSSMRRKFSVSAKGVNLQGLMTMASGLALQSRPLKLETTFLKDLKLPCILHWDMNHFVVLKSVGAKSVVIHDPAVGERKISLEELGHHFTGVAVEFSPAPNFNKGEDTQRFTLLSLMGRVTGLKRGLAQLLLMGLALQVCSLIGPFYMQWLIDDAILSSDKDLVTVLGIGFLLLVVVQTGIAGIRSWMSTVLATSLNFQWFGNVFSHLMKLPLSYFEKRHTGDIVSRFTSIQTMQQSLTTQFVEGIVDGVMVIGTLAMMVTYSTKLAAVSCASVLLYGLIRTIYFTPLRNATAERIVHAAKQQTHFLESIRGAQSIRLFGRVEQRQSSWLNALADQFNAELKISRLSVSYTTVNSFVFNAERVIILWLAALLVLDNLFSVGMLFAYISYKDQFSQRMAALVDKVFEYRMLKIHGERVADIVLTEAEDEPGEREVDVGRIASSIEVRNLSFRYSDTEPYLIKNLSLTIPDGQSIAVTGASGCGKTTLLKILLGLLEPTSGEILIGGINIKKLGLSNYRKMVGTVMQEDSLYAGSISDNISFFDPSPNLELITRCAAMSAIDADIAQMPMDYSTLVGDIGSGVSGGQKQRILLARALYKMPSMMFLDEATSHLDVPIERTVNEAVQRLQMTRIIIAHRPETIATAERVVTLVNGGIGNDSNS